MGRNDVNPKPAPKRVPKTSAAKTGSPKSVLPDSLVVPKAKAPRAVLPATPKLPTVSRKREAAPLKEVKKPGTPASSNGRAVRKKAAAPKSPQATFTDSDVALRAYFISEKRRHMGLPGDEHTDWVEAERQLREEAAQNAKPQKTSRKSSASAPA